MLYIHWSSNEKIKRCAKKKRKDLPAWQHGKTEKENSTNRTEQRKKCKWTEQSELRLSLPISWKTCVACVVQPPRALSDNNEGGGNLVFENVSECTCCVELDGRRSESGEEVHLLSTELQVCAL